VSAAATAVEIIAATIPALGGSYFAYRQGKKAVDTAARQQTDVATIADRAATLRIESEAYERARAIYESALRELEKQLDRLQGQLERVNAQLAQERDTSAGLRAQIHGLEAQIGVLEATVAALRRELTRSTVDSLHSQPGTEPLTDGGQVA
jgi:chromosome segregation ATPase